MRGCMLIPTEMDLLDGRIMTDDLSVGELGRAVASLRLEIQAMAQGINARLDKVVSTEVYGIQTAYTDQRITTLVQDLAQERSAREAIGRDLERYQLSEAERRERGRQTRVYQAIIPVALATLAATVTVWGMLSR